MARSKMIMVRVDEAEHALFKGAAAAVKISMSEYARDAMLARMALEEAQEHEDEWRRGFPEVAAVVVEEIQGASPHSEDFVSGGGPVKAATADRAADVPVAGSSPAGPLGVIKSPGEVPAAVFRVTNPEREYTPFSKEQQTGKARKKKLAQAEPVQSCRHGLLRCKVCGTG